MAMCRAPAEQFADLQRAARAALDALNEPHAAIALIVARPLEGGGMAMHCCVAGAGGAAVVGAGGDLADFIAHRLMSEATKAAKS